MAPLVWRVRRALWEGIILLKYRLAKPAPVPLPPRESTPIRLVPMHKVHPSIEVEGIRVADNVPLDEDDKRSRRFYELQYWLSRFFGPHMAGLPQVDEDPTLRLRHAYGDRKRRVFPAPVLPDAFQSEEPDLGRLAVAGPYWGYLEPTSDGRWEWDLREMGDFEHWPGLRSLGCRVVFGVAGDSRRLEPEVIECELGSVKPGDANWPLARAIALCALTTYSSIVRHFNGIHLAIGGPLAVATRNRLAPDHPIGRLLWPHIYRSQFSNELITLAQMAPPGDFAMIFSYTPRGLWDLCESTSKSIRIQDYDPETSAHDRGLVGAVFDTPSLTNLCSLFTLFHDHATAYVDAYYASDEDLAQDAALGRWLEDLQTTIPNGVPLSFASLSRAGLSRLLALLMHVGVVEHEFRGTFLWNYQLWTHMQPVRVYRDGRREPVDVYQRLVNANLILNVNRTTLDTDFSYLALDGRGAELFRAFRQKLHELQAALNDEPRQVWKLYPDMLNANMNA